MGHDGDVAVTIVGGVRRVPGASNGTGLADRSGCARQQHPADGSNAEIELYGYAASAAFPAGLIGPPLTAGLSAGMKSVEYLGARFNGPFVHNGPIGRADEKPVETG